MATPTSLPLHVLVIDDDSIMTELLLAILSLQGHNVMTASSGEEALDMLSNNAFHVVLTDLQLPGLSGSALANTLRKTLPAHTKLIGMSGSQPSAAARSAYDAFLLKPFTVEDFARTISTTSRVIPISSPVPVLDPASQGIIDDAVFTRLSRQLPPPKLRELYQLTLDDIAKRLDRMKASEDQGDSDSVRREAHAIKGGCGMVGATELRSMAATREGGAASNTPPLVDFHAACDRLRRMLDARFNGL